MRGKSPKERDQYLRWYYGITLEEYEKMLVYQDGVCAICGGPPCGSQRLFVDHDHETGVVRGLLCGRCNSMLGLADDSPHRLAEAMAYLTKTST